MLLPEELYAIIWKDLSDEISHLQYSRAIMPLSALLDGVFFNSYIKTGR